jgi:hypothetical protein
MDINSKRENLESAISYGVGISGFSVASLADLTSMAQSAIVFLTLLVVAIRLAHDAVRFIRFIKSNEK